MAYISPETVKEIRNELKVMFPTKKGWKLSVTGSDYMSVNIYIMKAPMLFSDKKHEQLNHFYLVWYKNSKTLLKMRKVCWSKPGDFYLHMNVGKWNKEFELTK